MPLRLLQSSSARPSFAWTKCGVSARSASGLSHGHQVSRPIPQTQRLSKRLRIGSRKDLQSNKSLPHLEFSIFQPCSAKICQVAPLLLGLDDQNMPHGSPMVSEVPRILFGPTSGGERQKNRSGWTKGSIMIYIDYSRWTYLSCKPHEVCCDESLVSRIYHLSMITSTAIPAGREASHSIRWLPARSWQFALFEPVDHLLLQWSKGSPHKPVRA